MNYEKFSCRYSSALPDLSELEYQALKDDIVKRGIVVPIVTDEYFNVIDGQNRLRIAQELSLKDIPFDIRIGLSDDEKQQLALDLNLHRRHLSKEQRKEIVIKLRQNGLSQRAIADKVGVDQKTIHNDLHDNATEENSSVELPETITGKDGKKRKATKPVYATAKDLAKIEKIVSASQEDGQDYLLDELSETGNINRGNKEVNRLAKEKKRQNITVEVANSDSVWHGDFRVVGQKIPDNSVDLIFTDPPYNEDAIELYRDLGVFAARVLKPGGLCLAYSGQIHLPQVLNALGESLEYIWCFAIKHTSGYTRIFKINGRNMWKPVIMFAKSPYQKWWKTIDDMIDGKQEKLDHEWQQGLSEARYYLSSFCSGNNLIVDPFCGSGTTLLAAKQLKLNYIGIEDDLEDVNKSISRLNDC